MASIIKADNIQKVSDGSNIIKKCGSTITLGSCGATIALACGATQTGFGQTYSAVAYCTTAKTSPFTAAAGTGYFINTTCGAVTVTLPASPTAGDVVAFKDYASQWNTNSVTLCNNGNKINGVCATASLSTQNQSVSLIYVDGTKGWQDIQDSTAGVTGNAYITATGGTITTCGDYKIHTFTSDGCFSVSNTAACSADNIVDYVVVAGGGASGATNPGGTGAGGGGAGGFRFYACTTRTPVACSPASPLNNFPAGTAIPLSVTTYPITVGAGGSPAPSPTTGFLGAGQGGNSIFSTITSTGGGGGGYWPAPSDPNQVKGQPGGSGGGAASEPPFYTGGSGNTPPVSPPQGNNGGLGSDGGPSATKGGGGGGGAIGTGSNAVFGSVAGSGGAGAGIPSAFGTSGENCGAYYYFSGGGGGGIACGTPAPGPGGIGGGGDGGAPGTAPVQAGTAGTANTGGGGGGKKSDLGPGPGNTGGSGIVIIRYKYQ